MDEEITRAASGSSSRKTSTTAKKKTSSTSTAKKKTSSSSTAKKKTSSTSTAKKKTSSSSTAKKKTSTSSTLRLTAAEKKMITNYRKCGTLQKQIIALVIEKVAGGVTKLEGIERMINTEEGNDQGGVL